MGTYYPSKIKARMLYCYQLALCCEPAACDQVVVDAVSEYSLSHSSFAGLAVYLDICARYASVFTPGTSKIAAIKSLATVVFFVRIWERWLRAKGHSSRDVENMCITSATRTDLEISAACVINLMSFVHDCPDKHEDVLIYKVGSDVDEDLFGFFGTYRSNCRVYNAVAACDKVQVVFLVYIHS